MATHSSILAWRIPWTEEPGELQSMGSKRVGQDWLTNTHTTAIIVVWPECYAGKEEIINCPKCQKVFKKNSYFPENRDPVCLASFSTFFFFFLQLLDAKNNYVEWVNESMNEVVHFRIRRKDKEEILWQIRGRRMHTTQGREWLKMALVLGTEIPCD